MQRTDLLDTSLEMHRIRLRLSREKGPAWRVRRAVELSEGLKAFRKATKHLRLRDRE